MGLAVVAFGVLLWNVWTLRENVVKSTALQDAKLYAQALAEFRTLYTSEVVQAVSQRGILVTHDYEQHEGAIPLPATLSMKLGERIGSHGSGAKSRLYSPYPFPWRKAEGGLRDEFARRAWAQLSAAPDEPIYDFEEVDGLLSLRYAIADRMRPSCVGCHNTHPESPKTDWKSGDVRGVLEVILPLDAAIVQTNPGLRRTFFLMAVVSVMGLSGLALVVGTLRRSSREAHVLAAETERVNQSLEAEIADRERLEEERRRLEEERRRLEEQVQRTQKLESLGVLAGGIAHDFNNLLTPILSYVELVREEVPPESDAYDSLEEIDTAAARAADLCGQILAYSGRRPLATEFIDLNSVVEETAHLLEISISKKCVLEYELAPDLPPIRGDATQIEQIILNLITNASEAIGLDSGGIATVR